MGKRKRNLYKQKTSLLRNFFRFIIGIALIPAAAAACFSSCKIALAIAKDPKFTIPLMSGAAAYSLIALIARKTGHSGSIFYIAAHEFSHAITALLSGEKVFDIKINKTHGNVLLSGSNFIIGLAPYFLPIYAIITVIAYYIAAHFWPELYLKPYFLAAAGFFLAFHFIHTTEVLLGPLQPDLEEEGGRFFSFPVIILFSCAASAAILAAMYGSTADGISKMALMALNDQKAFYFKTAYLLKYIYEFYIK